MKNSWDHLGIYQFFTRSDHVLQRSNCSEKKAEIC